MSNSSGIRPGSVLAADKDVNVLVLGEASVGKSYFIQAYMSNRTPKESEVPPVHPVFRISPAIEAATAGLQLKVPTQNTRVLIDSDGVKLGASADDIHKELRLRKPDVIVLCYSNGDPMSLARLATHWLPSIHSSPWKPKHGPYIPIVLSGLREDELQSTTLTAWTGAYRTAGQTIRTTQASSDGPLADDDILNGEDPSSLGLDLAELRDRAVELLMLGYPSLLCHMPVSAKQPAHPAGLLGEIGEVWDKAMDQVLHPVFPLYDHAESCLTPACAMALSRIFRMCDADGDGLLAADEFSRWQTLSFGYRVSDEEVRELFTRLYSEQPEAVNEDASALTEIGFRHILISYIFGLSADSVWTVLQAFGYRWGIPPSPHVRLSLELGAYASEFMYGSAEGTGGTSAGATGSPSFPLGPSQQNTLYLACPDAYVQREPRTADGSLVLSGSSSNKYSSSSPTSSLSLFDELCRTDLKHKGLGFVARLFKQYATGGQGRTLTAADIQRIFEVTPSGSHPFGSLFPDVTTHAHDGGIGLTAWINLWQMMLTITPGAALAALYHVGYYSHVASLPSRSGSASEHMYNPVAAVEDGGARKSGGDLQCSPVRRLFVLGSAGSGKTSFILHSLNGPGNLRDRTANLHTFSRDDRAGPLATHQPTHYVLEGSLPEGETRQAQDACPAAMVITEWPADSDVSAVMQLAESQADAVLVTVDPALPCSVAYLRRVTDRVPDGVPTVVVACGHDRDKDVTGIGHAVLSALCMPDAHVDLSRSRAAVGDRPASPETNERVIEARKCFVKAVNLAYQALEVMATKPSEQYAASLRAGYGLADLEAQMGSRSSTSSAASAQSSTATASYSDCEVPGLALELFNFGPRVRHDASLEVLRYITSVSLRPGIDNPQTGARRSKRRLQQVVSVLGQACGITVGVTVMVGVGAVLVDYKGARGQAREVVKGVVSAVGHAVTMPFRRLAQLVR